MKRINITLDNITLDAMEIIKQDALKYYPGIKITTSDIVRVAIRSVAGSIENKTKN